MWNPCFSQPDTGWALRIGDLRRDSQLRISRSRQSNTVFFSWSYSLVVHSHMNSSDFCWFKWPMSRHTFGVSFSPPELEHVINHTHTPPSACWGLPPTMLFCLETDSPPLPGKAWGGSVQDFQTRPKQLHQTEGGAAFSSQKDSMRVRASGQFESSQTSHIASL